VSRSTLVLVAAAVVAVVAAIVVGIFELTGGAGKSYSVDASASCLTVAGVAVDENRDDLDFIAMDAGEGAFEADLGSNTATVVFERSSGAEGTAKQYGLFAKAFGGGNIDRHGNLVVAWDNTPTDDERATIDGCLR
jgi:hypothetical protein